MCMATAFPGTGKLLSLCETSALRNPGGLAGRGFPKKVWGEGFLEEMPPHSHSRGAAICSFSCSQPCWGHIARRGTKPALCELSKPPQLLIKIGAKDGETGGKASLCGFVVGNVRKQHPCLTAEVRQARISAWSYRAAKYA